VTSSSTASAYSIAHYPMLMMMEPLHNISIPHQMTLSFLALLQYGKACQPRIELRCGRAEVAFNF